MLTALISMAELKAHLPIRPGNTDQDEKVKRCILIASAMIENAVQRHFTKTQRTERFASRQSSTLMIDLNGWSDTGVTCKRSPQYFNLQGAPLSETDPVEVRYDLDGRFDDTSIIDPTDYVVDYDQGVVTGLFATRAGFRSIKISYTAGLDSAVAADETGFNTLSAALDTHGWSTLKSACVLQALHAWNKLDINNISLNTDRVDEKKGTRFVMWAVKGGLLPDVQSLVRPYRRVSMGRG